MMIIIWSVMKMIIDGINENENILVMMMILIWN